VTRNASGNCPGHVAEAGKPPSPGRPQKPFRSIRTRLVVHFSLLFAVILFAVKLIGIFGIPFTPYSGTWGQERDEVFRSLDLIADLKKERLLRWIEERRDDTHVIAENPMVRANVIRLRTVTEHSAGPGGGGPVRQPTPQNAQSYKDLTDHLTMVKRAYGVYRTISIADADTGTVLVSTEPGHVGENVSEKFAFQKAVATPGACLGAVEPGHDGSPVFDISHAIGTGDGAVVAVLLMAIDMDDIISPMLHTGEGLGERGEALLVDQNVRVLTSLKHALPDGSVPGPLGCRLAMEPAALAARGEEGIIESEDYRGEPVLAAYRHLRLTPELAWGMVVKRDKAELFGPLRRDVAYTSLLGVLAVLVTVGLIIVVARSLTSSILALSSAAEKVADGDLEVQAPVTSPDEAGMLARTFNTMVRRLRDRHQELEEQVRTRTAELTASNRNLSAAIDEHRRTEQELRVTRDRAEQRAREMRALLESSRAILEYREFQQAARVIFDRCKKLIGATAGYVAVLSGDGTENEVLFLDAGGLPCDVDPSLPMPIRGLRAEAYRTAEVVYDNDFAGGEWMQFMPEGHVRLDNVLFAPLVIEGRTLGLLGLANKPGGFTDDDARMAGAFGKSAAIALRNSRTLEALEDSERHFRSVAQSATDALISADGTGTITFWNSASETIFGYTAEEMTGQPLTRIMPERFKENHQAGLDRLVRTGESRVIGRVVELTGLRKDGTEFPIELSLASWKAGEEPFFTAIIRDISARKQAEHERERLLAQVEQEEQRLKTVLQQMPAGVLIAEAPSGKLILANEQVARILRHPFLPADTIEAYTQYKFYHPDGRPYEPEEYPLARSLLSGQTVIEQELGFQRGDGSQGTMVASSAPIHDGPGNVIAAVMTFRDITTRKRMQGALRRSYQKLEARVAERTAELAEANERLRRENEARRQAEDELLHSHELLEKAFANVHVLLAYLDRDFNFIRVNRAYALADGRDPEFFVGKNHFALYPHEENEAVFRDVVRTGEPYYVYEKPFVRPGGPDQDATYWDWSLRPVKEPDGTVSGLLLTLLDVTERVQAQQRLQEYQRELRSLASELSLAEERARRRIATDLHDHLGQLLALTKMYLGAAEARGQPGPQAGHFSKMRDLLEQSIEYTRSITFELSSPALYQLGLEAALERLAETIQREHGIHTTFVHDAAAKPLGDDIRVVLYQAGRELLLNAVKHAQATNVQLSVKRVGGEVSVTVRDDGVGFDISEIGPHASRSTGGFGLFSIRERLSHLGGRLEISSEKGRGTAATLVAPLSTDEEDEEEPS